METKTESKTVSRKEPVTNARVAIEHLRGALEDLSSIGGRFEDAANSAYALIEDAICELQKPEDPLAPLVGVLLEVATELALVCDDSAVTTMARRIVSNALRDVADKLGVE